MLVPEASVNSALLIVVRGQSIESMMNMPLELEM
jgi:hypothetical protein